MSIFKKLFTAVRGGATEVGEAIVDSQAIRILEQELRDSKTALNDAKTNLTAIMAEKMGGPTTYMGKAPKMAHRAMYINQELFDIRQRLLDESLIEAGLNKTIRDRWLKIDNAFKGQIVKESIKSFYSTTWKYEKRIIIPKPDNSSL